jgi:hypothetical protein
VWKPAHPAPASSAAGRSTRLSMLLIGTPR